MKFLDKRVAWYRGSSPVFVLDVWMDSASRVQEVLLHKTFVGKGEIEVAETKKCADLEEAKKHLQKSDLPLLLNLLGLRTLEKSSSKEAGNIPFSPRQGDSFYHQSLTTSSGEKMETWVRKSELTEVLESLEVDMERILSINVSCAILIQLILLIDEEGMQDVCWGEPEVGVYQYLKKSQAFRKLSGLPETGDCWSLAQIGDKVGLQAQEVMALAHAFNYFFPTPTVQVETIQLEAEPTYPRKLKSKRLAISLLVVLLFLLGGSYGRQQMLNAEQLSLSRTVQRNLQLINQIEKNQTRIDEKNREVSRLLEKWNANNRVSIVIDRIASECPSGLKFDRFLVFATAEEVEEAGLKIKEDINFEKSIFIWTRTSKASIVSEFIDRLSLIPDQVERAYAIQSSYDFVKSNLKTTVLIQLK